MTAQKQERVWKRIVFDDVVVRNLQKERIVVGWNRKNEYMFLEFD